jgi:membrane associated rhomboid family serine protease
METQQQQAQSFNASDATGVSVQRMNDTDDRNTNHDDITFSMTESNSIGDDGGEYPMDDISLRDDEETVGQDSHDCDHITLAPSLVRCIDNDAVGALKHSKRPSNRDLEGSDTHTEDCSIQSLDISRMSDSIQSLPEASRYSRRGACTQSDLLKSAVLAQSFDTHRKFVSIRSLPQASTLQDNIKELRDHVRATRNQRAQQSTATDASQHDQDLALRLKDFHRARHLRSKRYRTTHGIIGLFVYLADVRLDLEWAADAARRREQGEPFFSWVDFEYLHWKKIHPCPFTYLIMFLSTIMLVVSIGLNGWKFAPLKVNPMFGPDPSVLIDLGGLLTAKIVEENEWYRLLVPIVLHAGVIHYVINMLVLWWIGTAVERVHGTIETAVVFILSGIGGNLASANFMPNSVSVGASGGLYGLLGFCLVDVLTNWDLLTINKPFPCGSAIFWLGVDLVLSLGIGLTPYVDNFAHLGGFLFGICFGLSLLWRSGGSDFFGRMTLARHYCHYAYAIIGAVVATFVFTAMVVLLLDSDGRTTVCPKCHYLSCAPFPFWTNDPWWTCDECQQSLASIVRLRNTSELDLTCPSGEIVTIDLMDSDPDRDDIRNQIIGYCRQLC